MARISTAIGLCLLLNGVFFLGMGVFAEPAQAADPWAKGRPRPLSTKRMMRTVEKLDSYIANPAYSEALRGFLIEARDHFKGTVKRVQEGRTTVNRKRGRKMTSFTRRGEMDHFRNDDYHFLNAAIKEHANGAIEIDMHRLGIMAPSTYNSYSPYTHIVLDKGRVTFKQAHRDIVQGGRMINGRTIMSLEETISVSSSGQISHSGSEKFKVYTGGDDYVANWSQHLFPSAGDARDHQYQTHKNPGQPNESIELSRSFQRMKDGKPVPQEPTKVSGASFWQSVSR